MLEVRECAVSFDIDIIPDTMPTPDADPLALKKPEAMTDCVPGAPAFSFCFLGGMTRCKLKQGVVRLAVLWF